MTPAPPPRRDGFALFAAIWTAMLLALITVGVSGDTRQSVQFARAEIAQAQAGALAEAAVRHLSLVLLAQTLGAPEPLAPGGRALGPLPRDGTPVAWGFEGAALTLSVQAQDGLIDLNTGDPGLIARYLTRGRAPQALVQAVLARRSPGRNRAVSWRLDNRPFNDLGDLAPLPGADRAVLDRLAPGLTVWGGTALPDPLTAPVPVWEALDLPPAQSRAWTARRADSPPLATPPPVLALRATARWPGGGIASAQGLLRLTPGAPVQIHWLAWGEAAPLP